MDNSSTPTTPTGAGLSALKELGYHIKDDRLLKLADGSSFEFVDQEHYDEVGEAVRQHIQERLVKDVGLVRVDLSEFATPGMVDKFPSDTPEVFVSRGVIDGDQQDTLLLVIQGSGAVRAGEWARRVCINDNIRSGSQIPYLERALKNGWDVIVFNPNQRHTFRGPISKLPVRNTGFVWEHFVEGREKHYPHIGIVAHSAGAQQSINLMEDHEDVRDRVEAIAFTDGVFRMASEEVSVMLNERGMNWVASSLPLDEEPVFHPVKTLMPCLSSGHSEHVYTSDSCIESVFAFQEKVLPKKEEELSDCK